jgi:hypothetical protein
MRIFPLAGQTAKNVPCLVQILRDVNTRIGKALSNEITAQGQRKGYGNMGAGPLTTNLNAARRMAVQHRLHHVHF